MKKTLLTLLVTAACAMAGDTLSYKTTAIGTPNAAYVHGFTFTISLWPNQASPVRST